MSYKTCPACRRISYCAAADCTWLCPCCGEDISNVDAADYCIEEKTPARPSIRLLRGVELSSLQQSADPGASDGMIEVM